MERAMDLDLNTLIDEAVAALPRGRRGKPSTPPMLVREITEDDLPGIISSPAPPPGDQPMKRLRHTHHLAARCLAEGRSLVETSAITGYTPARLGQLKNDPTFTELMNYYQAQVETKWLNVHERLATLGIALTEELQQRLEEEPEKFTNEELRKWAETALDRSGFGPSRTQNVNVKSQSATLHLIEQIKGETRDSAEVKLIAAE
jgi:hypothetical protein